MVRVAGSGKAQQKEQRRKKHKQIKKNTNLKANRPTKEKKIKTKQTKQQQKKPHPTLNCGDRTCDSGLQPYTRVTVA